MIEYMKKKNLTSREAGLHWKSTGSRGGQGTGLRMLIGSALGGETIVSVTKYFPCQSCVELVFDV